jgi:hypothetical protein
MRMRQAILVMIAATLSWTVPTCAQQIPAGATDKGWSSYSSFTETHDSSLGWSTILNSSVSYDFSRHFNSFFGVPIYFIQPYTSTSASGGTTTTQTSSAYNSLGDVYLGMTYKAGGPLGYSGTILGTAPTGSTTRGISTGRATVDWNNHFEHDIWQLTPFVEAGLGNSNTAMNLGRRNGNPHTIGLLSYATLGPMLHFQGGTELSLVKSISVYVSGYDMSPLGDQKVYSRLVKRNQGSGVAAGKGNAKAALTQNAVTSGTSALAVDRGFTAGVDFTPHKRVDIGCEFTRSATNAVNTVAFSIGYRFGHLASSGISK